ncbi:DUF2807 domain-containing protein [Bacteroidales bacterium OttesenSCG-928-K03]|nr:DUF2807 domain-containing protein [Bacteroidales bacterium OttesenSCG-928-L14]MDL2242186.1 DUF2807 domain-containing protein [Bacteroidales bacterium OttesenSCG-928-K03]
MSFFNSCKQPQQEQTITGNGNVVSEKRYCADFLAVRVYDNFVVQIYKNDIYHIEIEAESNLIYHIKYDINKQGVMTLQVEENYILEPTTNFPITIKIFTPETPEIILNGSSIIYYNDINLEKCSLSLNNHSKAYFINVNIAKANITLSDQTSVESDGFVVDRLEMSSITSSKIRLREVDINEATIVSRSAGDSYLTGKCNIGTFTVRSSGDIDTKEMLTSNCTITIESSGSIYAHVLSTLKGVINGSGNLYLKGDVNTDNVIIKNTGRVIPL